MTKNNLNAPRIADNQTSGQHRTANEALNAIDGAITNTFEVRVDDTNSVALPSFRGLENFRFWIIEGDTPPTADVDVTLSNSLAPRGLMIWMIDIGSFGARIRIDGMPSDDIFIPPQGFVIVDHRGNDLVLVGGQTLISHTVAVSDETTVLTTGTAKVTFRMPFRAWITEVRASLNVAQSGGSELAIDINEEGVSIFSTSLTIDNSSKTSVGATTPAVISDPELADDAEITVDIDTVGSGSPAGLKITLIGYRY